MNSDDNHYRSIDSNFEFFFFCRFMCINRWPTLVRHLLPTIFSSFFSSSVRQENFHRFSFRQKSTFNKFLSFFLSLFLVDERDKSLCQPVSRVGLVTDVLLFAKRDQQFRANRKGRPMINFFYH